MAIWRRRVMRQMARIRDRARASGLLGTPAGLSGCTSHWEPGVAQHILAGGSCLKALDKTCGEMSSGNLTSSKG